MSDTTRFSWSKIGLSFTATWYHCEPHRGSAIEAIVTERLHHCPGLDTDAARSLADVLRRNDWIMRALDAVERSDLPDAWIGAGAIRDVVWGECYGRFNPLD